MIYRVKTSLQFISFRMFFNENFFKKSKTLDLFQVKRLDNIRKSREMFGHSLHNFFQRFFENHQ